MKAIDKETACKTMNMLGGKGVPFLFIIDFDMQENYVIPAGETDKNVILYDLNGITNCSDTFDKRKPEAFIKHPISRGDYLNAFEIVQSEIHAGNTYLLNLTFPTKIETKLSLKEIYYLSAAPYKLWFNDRFVVFSPEAFVKISDGKISSYPMKGTIDAAIPNAEEIILNDHKETAEHNTIVDLIRNDLSSVALNVHVKRFRYVERIKTNYKDLLQVSSEITGDLESDHLRNPGDIIFTMLPAGSVTGAPKRKTVEIIKRAENYERGFYTGIFGYFDGKSLDSAVMIRYIEQDVNGDLTYKSGGGITAFSDGEKEYNELTDKVYVPVI